MALKFYAPVEFADTSAGLTVNGDLTLDNTSSNFLNLDISGATKGYLYSTASVVQLYGGGSYLRLTAKDYIRFDKGSANSYAEAMRLDGEGRLGIGTTSPNHRLDVYSNENVPLRIHRPSNTNLDSSGAWGIGFSTRGDANTSTSDTRAGIFSYYNGNLFIATSTSDVVADPDASARLTVTGAGNVGIGTTSPTSKTHIYYGGGATNGLHVQASANRGKILASDNDTAAYMIAEDSLASFGRQDALSANNLNITSGGNVLIGTTTDSGYKLRVNGTVFFENSSMELTLRDNNSTGNTASTKILFTDNGTFGTIGTIGFDGNDILQITNSHTGKILLSSTVGVGTSSPAYKLDVSGDIRSTAAVRANTNLIVGGYADITGVVNHRSDIKVLNKAATNWLIWAQRNTAASEAVINLNYVGNILPGSDSAYDIGSSSVRFANGYFDTLYGDGSNLTGITATETDTLATVTGRGASTSTSLTLSNTLNLTSTTKAIQLGPTSDNNSIYYIDCGNQIHIRANQSGTDNYYTNLMLMSGSSTQTASIGVIGRGNDSRLYFTTSNATKMQLFSTGNLGVGTSSDNGYKLDVDGDTNTNGDYYSNGTQGYTGTITIQQPSPQPPVNIDVQGGIITNVY